MPTPHCSAAAGMVAPPSIASTTRLRKSSEYGFAIHAGLLPVASLNHIRASMGIPDSAFSGNALMEPKRLGLLRDLVPGASLIGVLVNPSNPPAALQLRQVEDAARA